MVNVKHGNGIRKILCLSCTLRVLDKTKTFLKKEKLETLFLFLCPLLVMRGTCHLKIVG